MSKHVTFGGLGQHEFFLPTTGKGRENRRDRRRCSYYQAASKFCSKIQKPCVGPTICKKYSEKKLQKPQKAGTPGVGAKVYCPKRGEGRIITISKDICTVQFCTGKKVSAKYPDVLKKDFESEKAR